LFARLGQIAYTASLASRQELRRVLVLGAGLIGNLAAQTMLAHGVRELIVADPIEERLAVALRCGLRHAVSPRGLADAVGSITGGAGVDTVVEATGAPEIVGHALELVNVHGEVILLGSTRGSVDLDVYRLVHRKGTVLTGAHEMTIPSFETAAGAPSRRGMIETVLRWIASNTVSCLPLVSHRVEPSDIRAAYQGLMDSPASYLGVVVDWGA
jgi:threonine dehydrogenase-like Zn-dependent dehydrogenase